MPIFTKQAINMAVIAAPVIIIAIAIYGAFGTKDQTAFLPFIICV